jgi:hypothetical protein
MKVFAAILAQLPQTRRSEETAEIAKTAYKIVSANSAVSAVPSVSGFGDREVLAGRCIAGVDCESMLAGVGRRTVVAKRDFSGADAVERLDVRGPKLQRVLTGSDALFVVMPIAL